MVQVNVMAEHAAMRAVHGSPCPRCGQHHPEVVRWAEHATRERKKQELRRTTARLLFRFGIAAGIGFVLMLVAQGDLAELVFLGMLAATLLGVGRVLSATVRPIHAQWILYERTAPGVTFQTNVTS